jgi:hypothetical protein
MDVLLCFDSSRLFCRGRFPSVLQVRERERERERDEIRVKGLVRYRIGVKMKLRVKVRVRVRVMRWTCCCVSTTVDYSAGEDSLAFYRLGLGLGLKG